MFGFEGKDLKKKLNPSNYIFLCSRTFSSLRKKILFSYGLGYFLCPVLDGVWATKNITFFAASLLLCLQATTTSGAVQGELKARDQEIKPQQEGFSQGKTIIIKYNLY